MIFGTDKRSLITEVSEILPIVRNWVIVNQAFYVLNKMLVKKIWKGKQSTQN